MAVTCPHLVVARTYVVSHRLGRDSLCDGLTHPFALDEVSTSAQAFKLCDDGDLILIDGRPAVGSKVGLNLNEESGRLRSCCGAAG